jgi:hypothetical protein
MEYTKEKEKNTKGIGQYHILKTSMILENYLRELQNSAFLFAKMGLGQGLQHLSGPPVNTLFFVCLALVADYVHILYIVLKRRRLKLQIRYYLNRNLKLNHDQNLKPNRKQNSQHVLR